ncbi:MAG TPA: hypothetical protein VIT45_13225 [Allosphingosinicella sp.]
MSKDLEPNYLEFFEDFLIAAVRQHQISPFREVEVHRIFELLAGKYPDGWGQRIVHDLVSKGFAHEVNTLTHDHVAITWEGFGEGRRIEEDRQTYSIIKRIESDRSQRIVSIANFVVALSALIIALIALVKSD